MFGIPDTVFDVGAHPVPRLGRSGLGRSGHVGVGGDERVRVHVLDQTLQGEGELVFRDRAAAAGPRVGGDVGGGQPDPPHQAGSVGRPAGRGVVGHGDLSAFHPDRLGPRIVGNRRGGPPRGGVAGNAQGEVTAGLHRGPGDVLGEVAHIPTHPGPGGDPGRA